RRCGNSGGGLRHIHRHRDRYARTIDVYREVVHVISASAAIDRYGAEEAHEVVAARRMRFADHEVVVVVAQQDGGGLSDGHRPKAAERLELHVVRTGPTGDGERAA